jgi:hypothetical protein
MDVRYLGFDQNRDERAYRFDVSAKGELTRQFVVTADIALFRMHHIAIQEGPSLCASKLKADLAIDFVGAHTLTDEDLRLYAAEHAAAAAKLAETRRNSGRKPNPSPGRSPWRGHPA